MVKHATGWIVAGILLAAAPGAADWPQWRGPQGIGVSEETGLPTRWSRGEGIDWVREVAGESTATPILWGDSVFVVSQLGQAPVSSFRDGDTPGSGEIRFVVEAFHREDGRFLWGRVFPAVGPLQPVHEKHNLASPSPVTDGERLYLWFATGQLIALDLEGNLVWRRHLGEEIAPFDIRWAHGSSPALYEGTLLLLCDHHPAAYLLAVDARTGETRWKVDRGEERRAYTTPLVVAGGGDPQLIVNSDQRVDAYDPASGELLWHADRYQKVPVGSPVHGDGVVYTSRGYRSGPYLAVRAVGAGAAEGEAAAAPGQVLWRVETGAPYVSSLLLYRGLLYMANENGVLRTVDPGSGETVWEERAAGNFSASPVGADGKVYFLNEEGETWVVEAGRTYQLLAKNALGERTLASPAISRGRIYIRSDRHLFAIGGQVAEEGS
jgi:outer membrane protein assembly factor BamB